MTKNQKDWLLAIFLSASLAVIVFIFRQPLLSGFYTLSTKYAQNYVHQDGGNIVFENIGSGDHLGLYVAVKVDDNCFKKPINPKSKHTWLFNSGCTVSEYGFDGFSKNWDLSYQVDEFQMRKVLDQVKEFNEHVLLVGGSYTKGATSPRENTFIYQFKKFQESAGRQGIYNYAIGEGFWSPTNILNYLTDIYPLETIIKNTDGVMIYNFIYNHFYRVCPDKNIIRDQRGKMLGYTLKDNELLFNGLLETGSSSEFVKNYSFDANKKNCMQLFVKVLDELKKLYLLGSADRKFHMVFLPDQSHFTKSSDFKMFSQILNENKINYSIIKLDNSNINNYFWKNDSHYRPIGYKEVGKKLFGIYKSIIRDSSE